MNPAEPPPFRILNKPEELKAFTDPLRIRVLSILAKRAATNQQIADALGEPHAKVLYHIRFLLDVGLIQLVDQQIKGGNVEKYYRAVARMFGLRPGPEDTFDLSGWLEALRQEVAASATHWPEIPLRWEIRRARLAPERLGEFDDRLQALIAEYWGGPETQPEEDPTVHQLVFAELIYRDPSAPAPAPPDPPPARADARS
jgi:DNA-binding transcriptional ArsR family regulator